MTKIHTLIIVAIVVTLSSCANKRVSKHFSIENQSLEMILDTGASTSLLPLSYTPEISKASQVYFIDKKLSAFKGNIKFTDGDQTINSPCIFIDGLKETAIAGLPLLREISPIIFSKSHQTNTSTFELQSSLDHGFPLIPCEVDSKAYYLLLDTGSLRSILSTAITHTRQGHLRSIWESSPADRVSIDSNGIKLPRGIPPLKSAYSVFPVPHLKRIKTADGREVIGILGLDYILKNVAKIDLQSNTITTYN